MRGQEGSTIRPERGLSSKGSSRASCIQAVQQLLCFPKMNSCECKIPSTVSLNLLGEKIPCLLCLSFVSSSFLRGRGKQGKATGKVLFHINIFSGMQTGLFIAIQFDPGHTKGNGFSVGFAPSCQSWIQGMQFALVCFQTSPTSPASQYTPQWEIGQGAT